MNRPHSPAPAGLAWLVPWVAFVVGGGVVGVGGGCAPAPAPSPTSPCAARSDGRPVCTAARECAGGSQCVRASEGDACGACVPSVCFGDRDCVGGTVCDVVRGRCEDAGACDVFAPEEGCEAPALCAPVDTGAQCVAPVPSSCEIVPHVVVSVDGAPAPHIDVLFLDDAGRPLPVDATLDVPPLSCAGPGSCAGTVSAAGGGVSCSAPLVALPRVDGGGARVVVRDAETGEPLAGAAVTFELAAGAPVDLVADGDGVAAVDAGGAGVHSVRAAAAGYGTVGLFEPGGDDLELLLPRATPGGLADGAAFSSDLDAVALPGELRVGIATLSVPNLVEALTAAAVIGVPVDDRLDIEGITASGGDIVSRPSGGALSLDTADLFSGGVAFGAPGARLLSMTGGSARISAVSDALGPVDGGHRPFDFIVALWRGAEDATAFDVAGTVSTVPAPLPATAADLGAFASAGEAPLVRPRLDASDQVDVSVQPLLPGDDAAWVALYAQVPGRGLVLVSLRLVVDDDGDGLLDVPTAGGQLAPPGLVRLFVPPTLWTAGRPLIAVAGSTTRARMGDGLFATERAAAPVTTSRVTLPAFPAAGGADIDGAQVTVPPRRGELIAVDGVLDGGPARVYLGPDTTQADTGLDEVDRVWSVTTHASASFAAGSLDVSAALAAPSTVRALFGGE